MTPSTLSWQQDNGTLHIQGRLTASQAHTLAKAVPTLRAGTTINLGGAERVDSAGVALLLNWAQTQANPPLEIENAPVQFRQLVDIFRLGGQFKFTD